MFIFLLCLFICLGQDSDTNHKKEFEKTKGFCSKGSVALQERFHWLDTGSYCQEVQPFEAAPQRWTSVQSKICQITQTHYIYNGDYNSEVQDLMALCALLEISDRNGTRVPELWRPLDSRRRPLLRSQAAHTEDNLDNTIEYTDLMDMELMECRGKRFRETKAQEVKIHIAEGQRTQKGWLVCRASSHVPDGEPICRPSGSDLAIPIIFQFEIQNRCLCSYAMAGTSYERCAQDRHCRSTQTQGSYWNRPQGRDSHGSRNSGSFEIFLPRPLTCTTEDQGDDREGGKGIEKGLGGRHQLGHGEAQASQKNSGQHSRGQGATSPILALALGQKCYRMEKHVECLHEATGTFQRADQKHKTGNEVSQPDSGCDESKDRSRPGRRHQNRGSQGCTRYGEGPERGGIERARAKRSPAVHRLDQRRSHRNRRGGLCTKAQTGEISRSTRADRWAGSWLVKLGSVVACLRNGTRSPFFYKHVHFEAAESYSGVERDALDKPHRAVYHSPEYDAHRPIHSILLEADCIHDFDAQCFAWCLQAECIYDNTEDVLINLNAMTACLSNWRDVTRTTGSLSSPSFATLCESDEQDDVQSVVTLNSLHEPRTMPCQHSKPLTWSLQDQARDEANQLDLMRPSNLAYFSLPIFERTLRDISQYNGLSDLANRIPIATWYIDQQRIPAQRVRRDVWLHPDPALWREEILSVWRDQAIADAPASFFIVHPGPQCEQNDHAVHVLVAQSPVEGLASILLQIDVDDQDYQLCTLRADTVARVANYDMLFQVAQLGHHCTLPNSEVICSIKCGDFEYPINQMIVVEDAVTIAIKVYNHLQLDSSPFANLQLDDEDATVLVQRSGWTMRPQQPKQCRFLDIAEEVPWEISLDNPTGHIPNLPTVPIEAQASWIQDLHAAWQYHQSVYSNTEAELTIRSWYLNPERFTRWERWRTMTLPSSTDYWWNTLKTTWFDIIDESAAVEVHLVRPDPPRPPMERAHHFDIIIAQNMPDDERPVLVVSKTLGMAIRFHTAAEIVPDHVSGWQLIYHVGNDQFCSGVSWSHDFHRTCHVYRGLRLIGAQPTAVQRGDCFEINIYPPHQILTEEPDETWFMGRNPIIRRQHDDPLLVPNHDDQGQDLDEHLQPGRWYNVIVFALNKAPTIGRIASGDLQLYYNQIAHLLGMRSTDLIDLHEIRSPPHDLQPSFDYILTAHRLHDLEPGTRAKLVLCDIEFCNNLPAVDTETIRHLKLIVSPMTRTNIVRMLGLRPYCQKGPCLVKLNDQFIHATGPVDLQHGDFLHIVVGPIDDQQQLDTRTAALVCHHGYGPESFGDFAHHLPAHMNFAQMPNNEYYLDSLPYDDDGHLELMQRTTHVHSDFPSFRRFQPDIDPCFDVEKCNLECSTPDPLTCHNDGEIQETLGNLREIQNQRDRDAEDDIMEALNVERPVIRDLHGFWLRLAEPWLNNRRWLEVQVWYISHARWRICVSSRPVWLGEDFTLWYDTILQTWADEIDALDSVTLLIVSPQPEDDEGQVTCHVILVQHDVLPEEEGAALVCLSDDDYHRGRLECQAMVLPLRITHELLLTVSNRISQCLRVPSMARCTTSFGLFDLTHEPMRGRPGFCYHVKIRHRSYNPMSVSFPMTVPAASPTFVHALHAAIRRQQDLHPGEAVNLRIVSWFLNHHDTTTCLYGREVDLPPNPTMWMVTILQQWPDLYKPDFAVDVYLVQPTPQASQWQHGDQFHLILHQQPLPDHISVLTTTFDGTRGSLDPPGLHQAIVVPRHVTRQEILRRTEISFWCEDEQARRHCLVHYSALNVEDDPGLIGDNGSSFRITILQAPAPTWDAENETVPAEGVTLLQTQAITIRSDNKPTTIQLEKCLLPPNLTTIACHDVAFLMTQCISTSLGVVHDLHNVVKWHDNTVMLLQDMPMWTNELPLHFDFYTDGSASHEATQAASAVVLLVTTVEGPRFGGFRAFALEHGTAPRAEACAVLMATWWGAQLAHAWSDYMSLTMAFHFDCLFAGYTTAGYWRSQTHLDVLRPARALALWIQATL